MQQHGIAAGRADLPQLQLAGPTPAVAAQHLASRTSASSWSACALLLSTVRMVPSPTSLRMRRLRPSLPSRASPPHQQSYGSLGGTGLESDRARDRPPSRRGRCRGSVPARRAHLPAGLHAPDLGRVLRHPHRDRLDPASFRRHLTDPACIVLVADDTDADPVGYTMLLAGEPTDPDVAQAIRLRADRRAGAVLRPSRPPRLRHRRPTDDSDAGGGRARRARAASGWASARRTTGPTRSTRGTGSSRSARSGSTSATRGRTTTSASVRCSRAATGATRRPTRWRAPGRGSRPR